MWWRCWGQQERNFLCKNENLTVSQGDSSITCLYRRKGSLIDMILWHHIWLELSLVEALKFVVWWRRAKQLFFSPGSIDTFPDHVAVFVFGYSACSRGRVYFPFQTDQTELWIWHRRTVMCPNESTDAGEDPSLSCLRTRHSCPSQAALFTRSGKCCILIRTCLVIQSPPGDFAPQTPAHRPHCFAPHSPTPGQVLVMTQPSLRKLQHGCTPLTRCQKKPSFFQSDCLVHLGFHSNKS